MTGLDVERHRIVELAVIVTDARARGARRRARPRRAPAARGAGRDGRLRAQDAHAVGPAGGDRAVDAQPRSGRQAASSTSRGHVAEAGTAPMCGNSIGVDRRFLDAYLPELDEYLHYRSIDVSSLKELCRRWYPDVYKKRPGKSRGAPGARRHPRVDRRAPLLPRAHAPRRLRRRQLSSSRNAPRSVVTDRSRAEFPMRPMRQAFPANSPRPPPTSMP